MFSDTLLTVVGAAEGELSTDALFAIVHLIRETDDTRAHLAWGAREATPEAIAATAARSRANQGYVADEINIVNVSHLIRTVRIKAARNRIDLFLPAPDSIEFAEMMQPYATLEGGIVTQEVMMRRDRAAQHIGAQVRALAVGRGAVGREARPAAA
ncbi:hypothetical protein ACVWZ4_001010 [Bradyrhizobium sp. USDA 4472]